MALLGPLFLTPNSPPKKLCGFLFAFFPRKLGTSIFSWGPRIGGFRVGAKKFMLKKLIVFCPLIPFPNLGSNFLSPVNRSMQSQPLWLWSERGGFQGSAHRMGWPLCMYTRTKVQGKRTHELCLGNAEGSRNPWVIKFHGRLGCWFISLYRRDHSFDSLHSEFLFPLNFATHENGGPFRNAPHKQIWGIVPGLGVCQKVVFVFFLGGGGHSLMDQIRKKPSKIAV